MSSTSLSFVFSFYSIFIVTFTTPWIFWNRSQSPNNSQQEAFEERIPKEKSNVDEEKLQKERRKAIGNVIFIGELFQVNLIPIQRVLLCIGDLIRQLDVNLKQPSLNVFVFRLCKISMTSMSLVLLFVVCCYFLSLSVSVSFPMQFSCIVYFDSLCQCGRWCWYRRQLLRLLKIW
jgi:hypothetical protein